MTTLTLYDYWRSSAAYRVRIALNWKNLKYKSVPVHLFKGEQHSDAYRAINPQGNIPMLMVGNTRLTQSLAIMEYLEEQYPSPALLPKDSVQRAAARAMAMVVISDMHPLNNLRVLKYLTGILQVGESAKNVWYKHWMQQGLRALEALAREHGDGQYCVGDAVSMADICLIPQMYNARRFHCPLDDFPTLVAIDKHCAGLAAFEAAHPELQPDAEK